MGRSVNFDPAIFNDAYLPYLESPYSYELYYGGSGSGKSVWVAQKQLYRNLKLPYHRLIFLRKDAVSVRDSQFQLFKDLIDTYGLRSLYQVKESSMDLICVNGNMLLSAGMNSPEKIKSIQMPTDIWCEEFTEFEYEDFEQLDLRLRGKHKTLFTGSFNPINEEHWIKTKLVDRMAELNADIERWKLLKTTFKDNRFIDHVEYEAKLARQSPHNQRIYRFGDWGLLRTGKEYFHNFVPEHTVRDLKYDPNLPIHLTFDFNVNPYMTCLICQMSPVDNKMQVRVIDELCLGHPLNKTRYVCEKFLNHPTYKDHKAGIFYYGDATSIKNNTMTVEEIRHDYDIIESVLRVKLHRGSARLYRTNPAVLRRRDFVIDILQGNTPIELFVNRTCKNMINDFLYLKEGADGKKFKETEEDEITGAKYQRYGHTSDALEYLLCRAFEKIFLQYERR